MNEEHVKRLHTMAEIAYSLDGMFVAAENADNDEFQDCLAQMWEAEKSLQEQPQDEHSRQMLQQLQRLRPTPRANSDLTKS